ncbi:hypothetical protein QQS21_000101 [Conoideocrella luteorostrata]|uniref:DUF2961 domain-containing protein n=1 Tax=Conoideocrella luteorostrata TaxID=1105319 RepID=A0AAJ0D1Q9_9HYPO|nr:hypothetical protein QQS21_000101 [Conoideocrella luteorostrata]
MKLALLLGLTTAIAANAWPMVGLDAYRNYDLYKLRPGEETHQFSSYDRANHNDDGFDGTYSCLKKQGSRCVIAEYNGPGEIASIWFTYEPDSVAKVGDINIRLDGKDVLSGRLQDIVSSGHPEPFAWPFVGDTNDTMGGNVIKVPMSFGKSMLVTTQNNPHFYHVTYRRFPPHVKPPTFDPNASSRDVAEAHTAFGVRDPKAIGGKGGVSNGRYMSGQLGDRAEGASMSDGCGVISALSLRIPSVQATSLVQDDGRAFGKGGGSSFKLRLDPYHKQCQLTRRIDRTIGCQRVEVKVNGRSIGTHDSGDAANGIWADQVLAIPPDVTRGADSIVVRVVCQSSDLDCNEFFYALHCKSESGHWKTPGYMPSKDWVLMDLLNVGGNNPHDEKAHNYKITGQTWQGLRQFTYKDSTHSPDALPDIRISLTFDGKETVSKVPIGAFFGAGLAKGLTRSLMLSVDSMIPNGVWTTYFPMPFEKSAHIKLTTGDGKPVKASFDVVVQRCDGRRPSSQPWGHFSTQHRRGPTTTGKLWPFLSVKGPGVAYGVTHTFRGSILQPANTLEFLEGDEQVWLGRTTPGGFNDTSVTLRGTGTEDFYESGWYFQDFNAPGAPVTVPHAMPFTGLTNTAYGVPSLGCKGSCLSVYRQMLADSQAFPEAGISFNIEHGPDGNNINAEYETCAFYYA